jgi:uncharacterized protein (DUF433 family)
MATDTTKNQSRVQKTPGVCGGRACIRNTRITVWGVVNSRRLGAADEQILENIVGLTPADLDAAWDYYREHPAEIDEDIRDNEADWPLMARLYADEDFRIIRPNPPAKPWGASPEFCVLHAVAWSPDGSRVVSGSGDFTNHVWDSLLLVARPALTRDAALLPR